MTKTLRILSFLLTVLLLLSALPPAMLQAVGELGGTSVEEGGETVAVRISRKAADGIAEAVDTAHDTARALDHAGDAGKPILKTGQEIKLPN